MQRLSAKRDDTDPRRKKQREEQAPNRDEATSLEERDPLAGGQHPPHVDERSVVKLQEASGNAAVSRLVDPRGERVLARFPHEETIEQRLGQKLPGRAVVDPEACERRGVTAFTEGTTTHFATADVDLDVAAHEAAHLLQHSGDSKDAHLGAEGHANAIADAVAGDRDAAPLLARTGAEVEDQARAYAQVPVSEQGEGRWPVNKPLRVSNDGRIAVAQAGRSGSRQLYADPDLVEATNRALKEEDMAISLKTSDEKLGGPAPDGTLAPQLARVEFENEADRSAEDVLDLWSEVGEGGRQASKIKDSPSRDLEKVRGKWRGGGGEVDIHRSEPQKLADEIVRKALGNGDTALGWERYKKLTRAEREGFNQRTGIDRIAHVQIDDEQEEPGLVPGARDVKTWDFRWAGAVMAAGEDTLVLQDFMVGESDPKSQDWEATLEGTEMPWDLEAAIEQAEAAETSEEEVEVDPRAG